MYLILKDLIDTEDPDGSITMNPDVTLDDLRSEYDVIKNNIRSDSEEFALSFYAKYLDPTDI